MKGVSRKRMASTRRTKASEMETKTQEERATNTRSGFCLRGCTKKDDRTEYDFSWDDHKALIHAFLGTFTTKRRVEGIVFTEENVDAYNESFAYRGPNPIQRKGR